MRLIKIRLNDFRKSNISALKGAQNNEDAQIKAITKGCENFINENDIFCNSYVSILNKISENKELSQNIVQSSELKDVVTMQKLLLDLIQMDCVSFYRELSNIQENNDYDSVWFIQDKEIEKNIEIINSKAEKRIYSIKKIQNKEKEQLKSS